VRRLTKDTKREKQLNILSLKLKNTILHMKVLIVGAGAVGQIYGHYYAEGGSEVTYLVKPRHVEELKERCRSPWDSDSVFLIK